MTTKLWGGRFQKQTAVEVEKFNNSIEFDQRLYAEDIEGSIAHARMLGEQGIIEKSEAEQIIAGLVRVKEIIEAGEFDFKIEYEDIHMNIEKVLTDLIGPVAGKLHTARSRNDQVSLDTHLHLRKEIDAIVGLLLNFQEAILEIAEREKEVIFPGYTHLQRAQPIRFSHHLLAYFFMIERDIERLLDCRKRTDMMPLGAGAMAGTTFPIDREQVMMELGFQRMYENSLDAVSDRDYIIEFLSFASILMMHLSRLSEEIILWSSSEFGFIELDDAYSTGSSIMPQKKNPDVAELVRGKTGRVYGNLLALLTTMKGLPLAYNKDMQEDKEGLFDTIDTIKFSLTVYPEMLRTMKVFGEKTLATLSHDFSNATDLADYLVRLGIPFREAHHITGTAVHYAIQRQKVLLELSDEELAEISPLLTPKCREAISIEKCVDNRNSRGGTGKIAVENELKLAKESFHKLKEYLNNY